jgi:hypothetical protein
MKKKTASSKKKTASSKKKTKNSTGSPADHSARGSAAGKLEDQDAPVGIRAEGMSRFDPFAPTADEIQAAAARLHAEGSQSLIARGLELLKKGLEDPQADEAAHDMSGDHGTELPGGPNTEHSPEE